jgi:hypothetical protein
MPFLKTFGLFDVMKRERAALQEPLVVATGRNSTALALAAL